MAERRIGIMGAASLVGEPLLDLLMAANWQVKAFSRKAVSASKTRITWHQYDQTAASGQIPLWISLIPIWLISDYFVWLEKHGVQRIVVLSSTSRFTKEDADDPQDRMIADRLRLAEGRLIEWADAKGIEWVILRPTLIYGLGKDRNISEIAGLIQRFSFFPLLGKSAGLRQPVHAEDIAMACVKAIERQEIGNCAYNLAGQEQLPYREMVGRVFDAMHKSRRFLTIPRWLFHILLLMLKRFGRYSSWSIGMVNRMNQDMIFDYSAATRDLNFNPRPFNLTPRDLP